MFMCSSPIFIYCWGILFYLMFFIVCPFRVVFVEYHTFVVCIYRNFFTIYYGMAVA